MTDILRSENAHIKVDFLKKTFISKVEAFECSKHKEDYYTYDDMADKGAANIKRYREVNFPEGYNYMVVINRDH